MAAPQNTPAPPDELLSLQNEFRAISMLLTIVTAANHKGHSTLNPTHGKGPRPLRSLLNLRHQHRNTLILNAISALLVRDGRDVVSVVNRGSGDGYCIMGNAYTKVVMDGDDDFDEESTKLFSAALESGFTTFTNAGPKDSHFKDTSDLRVRLAHPGKSHWSKISQLESREIFELDKLRLGKNDPLENHIITTTDFLNVYREERDANTKVHLFWKFSAYLSLVCCHKTYRRIINWTSRGFIYNLAIVQFSVLRFIAKTHKPTVTSKSNRALFQVLSKLEEQGEVKDILSHLACIEDFRENKPADFSNLMKMLANDENDYDGETCVEFHCLVLGLLTGYGMALETYKVAYKAAGANLEDKTMKNWHTLNPKLLDGSLAANVWEYGRALWGVTCSQMFDLHLQVLHKTTFTAPSSLQENLYLARVVFGNPKPGCGDGKADGEDGKADGEDGFADGEDGKADGEDGKADGEDGKADGEDGFADGEDGFADGEDGFADGEDGFADGEDGFDDEKGKDSADGGVCGQDIMTCEEEDVEEDQRLGASLKPDKPNLPVPDNSASHLLKHWVRIITSYFQALDLLATAANKSKREIGAKFVVANHRNGHIKSPGLNWHEVIYKLCAGAALPATTMPDTTPNDLTDSGPQPSSSEESGASTTSFTAEKAITALQNYINADPDGLKIMAAFGKDGGDIPAGNFLWIGNLHSEAVAAAVFAFLRLVVDKEKEKDLYELIMSSDWREISVSRLCCPVCWELLQVLRGEEDRLQVRGYHTSFYPVELPSWLPINVFEEMVTRFREHLRRELVDFLKKDASPAERVGHKPNESISSTGTSSSHGTAFVVGYRT